jgi:Zn-dependent protease
MTSRDSWTLFRAGGVPVRIHFTWIFVAAWVAILISGQFSALARAADIRDTALLLPAPVWGVLLTLALFACVLLHEGAHVVVARRGGARVRSVTLMMLGGMSEIGEVDRPRLELTMSIAGPLASLALAVLFYGLYRLAHAGQLPPDAQFGLFYLAQVNAIIGVFNLLPAFPMDGGRVLRSLLTRHFGALRATEIAAAVGKVLAAGLVVLGIFGGGLWLALIGLFIFVGGDAEARAMQARAALRGVRVADLYARKTAVVDAQSPSSSAASAMLEARADVCFVVDGGRVAGVIPASVLAAIPARERASVRAASLAQKALVVSPTDEVPAVLRLLDEERLPAAAVVEGGRLVGSLTREDIARGLQLREAALEPV